MDNLTFEKSYQSEGFDAQRSYPNEPLLQFLGRYYFSIPKNKRSLIKILEIGCGSGANLWMVAKEGFSVFGIDISQTGIDLCRKALDAWNVSANLSVQNMRKLDFEDNYFDVIFDIVSMQHTNLQGHIETYNEIYRLLKAGGRFFQWHLGANSVSFKDGGGNLVDELTVNNIVNPNVPLSNNGLTCFLTPNYAEKMLKSTGFKDINIEIYTRTYEDRKQLIEYLAVSALK